MATSAREKQAARARRAKQARSSDRARTLGEWWPHYANELRSRDCRPATVRQYGKVLTRLERFIGADAPAAEVTPETLEAWRDTLAHDEGLSAYTVNLYLRQVGTFFHWLASEGVISEAPTLAVAYVKQRGRESAPPVFDAAQARALIGAARTARSGKSDYESVRDEALLSFLADTGVRATECVGLLLENLNLPARQCFIHAEVTKGRYGRTVTFGFTTAKLLGRYLRQREHHAYAWVPELWIGRRGSLSYSGVYALVRRTGRRAGVIGARPHLLRHTWAHEMKANGADLETLMSLGGWSNPQMVARYGRSEAATRAVEAYARMGSPVDRAGIDKGRGKSSSPRRRNTA
jgi:site-specific recombinase XerD